ncbi:MAG: preprotein translocase subunit YajC [Actinomycetota bacterium]
MGSLIIFLPLILIMYFLMIRPQQRRMREHQELINGLDVGDDVVTSSGIYGRVSDLDGDTIFLQVSDAVELKVTKESVAGLVTYGEVDDELVDDE